MKSLECVCHRESGSHEACCGHEDGRHPDCPYHGDGGNAKLQHSALGGHRAGFDPSCEACCRTKHPSGQADQDWHSELNRAAAELESRDLGLRLHRALSMAQRAAGQKHWESFDQWQALANKLAEELSKA